MHRGDQRKRTGPDPGVKSLRLLHKLLLPGGRFARPVSGQVAACRERASRAAQHHGPDRVVGLGLGQRPDDLIASAARPRGNGIQGVRAAEHNLGRSRRLHSVADVLQLHQSPLPGPPG